MAVETIGGVSATQSSSAVTSQSSVISQQEFLKILLTQLTLQDPLKPLDNEQFLAQLAQFTTLEQTRQTTEKLDTLLTIQSATQSIGLLGKTVDVAASNGSVTGQVTTLTFNNGQPALTIKLTDGTFLTDIGLSQISTVR